MFSDEIAVIIPAYKPSEGLLTMIDELVSESVKSIVVVNDGSGAEFDEIFDKAAQKGCTVLVHAVNMGKGRAMKTSFNHVLANMKFIKGVVIADADGQHATADIKKCADALIQNPESLIMGCRDFSSKDVPFRSKFGNKITRTAMKTLCGVKTTDTQTGLRAMGTGFMAIMLNVYGERYEFETNMLLETKKANVEIKEVTIETIYINENESSHFNPIKDSIRIYALLFKFVAASLASSIVDIVMFSVFIAALRPTGWLYYIPVATVLARVISATFNYLTNRHIVFESRRSGKESSIKYFLLCIVQVSASALLVWGLYSVLPVSEVAIKIVIDVFLFFISFQIQNKYIF